ncbi:MAG: GNAT family N-acetyltransferase [Oscillospiraceae bacterium]|nr:GNAT family N-acetyltransferase [Oscillospiraceae bacterium]
MTKIRVRPYRPEDEAAMAAIWNGVVDAGNAFPQTERLTGAAAAAFFAAQTCCGVAEDETGRVAGLYILHPNNVGRCGHICNASYAVAPGARGLGAGEALVRDCMARAAEHGFRILQFNAVVASNVPALNLYKKLGFTQLGVIPGGFRLDDGTWADIIPHYIRLV